MSYIIINLFLFTSWYIFFFRYKGFLSCVDRILSVFILGVTQIILTELLLGVVFRKLYAAQLFSVNIFMSSVVLIYAVSACRKRSGGSCGNYFSPLFANIFREISEKVVRFSTVIKSDLILLLILILFSVSVCWIIFLGYLFPSYTWDALWYHLPIAGYIMQNGAIYEVPNNSFIEQFINIFPKNIELLFIWNIIFLENDIVADLSQLLFAIAGVLAIYSIAVKMKINRQYAIYSSLLFFFTPIIILQSSTNYVDAAVSVLFLIAVNFLIDEMPCRGGFEIRSSEGNAGRTYILKRNITIIIAGLTAGILLGSKGSGPLFVGILSATVIIREFIWRAESSGPGKVTLIKTAIKSFTFYLIFFFIPVLLMGGYWYIKNWIIYGNPVYPMEITLFNSTIFKGLYQGIIEPAPEIINKLNAVTRPLYVWLDNVEYYLYDSRLGGLGPIWFILFLPGIVFALVFALIKRNCRFIVLFIILTAAFLMHPRNWNPRYVIFIVGLGALSFGLVSGYIRERKNAFRIIALLLAGYTFLISNSPCVTPEQIRKFMQLSVKERTIAMHAPFNIDLHSRQEYGYWIWISRNISQGETLAYTFEPLFLSPLWNRAFSNKIVYITSDDYKQWLKKLIEHKVTYVLTRKNSKEDKWIENERKIFSATGWMGALKEKYKIVYSDDNYRIARVLQNEG